MKKVAILVIVTVFALTGVAAAKGPGRRGSEAGPGGNGQKDAPGMFWEREKVATVLSLTEEEQVILTDLQKIHRNEIRELNDELREERHTLRGIMENEDFSSSDAKKNFKKAEKIRSEISKRRFEHQIEHRELLGQERYLKLRRMAKRQRNK